MDLIIIPKGALKTLTMDGYFLRFMEHTQTSKNYRVAYERTEDEHFSIFEKRRYSSYASFRLSKSRWIKRCLKRKKAIDCNKI